MAEQEVVAAPTDTSVAKRADARALHPKALAAYVLAAALLIPATRLPQIFSPNFAADGDECVVGLMAKHLSEGREFSVFFWGQRYGLCLPETVAGALAFRVAGISSLSLKAATLALWMAAWLLFVVAVHRMGGSRRAWIAGALLLLMPAWGAWAMKARGGYVTAFLLSNLCLVLLAGRGGLEGRKGLVRAAVIGACLPAIFFAQPFWLAATVPFVVAGFVDARGKAAWLSFGGAAVVSLALLVIASLTLTTGYWSPPLFRDTDVWAALVRLPYVAWVHLTGAYYYYDRTPIGWFSDAAGVLWLAGLVLAVLTSRTPRGEFDVMTRVRRACLGAVALTMFITLFVDPDALAFRYLLPMAAPIALLVADLMVRGLEGGRPGRWFSAGSFGALMLCGLGALFEQRGLRASLAPPAAVSERNAMDQLEETLESANCRHVFCLDPMLQWVLMFESRERIVARWLDPYDRRPEYPRAVDEAYDRRDCTALVAMASAEQPVREVLDRSGESSTGVQRVAGRYLVVFNPSSTVLRRFRFVRQADLRPYPGDRSQGP